MIFISHASEDNEFTLWLALQLAKEGYGVWCDLTKLLGGEDWPQEINQALQKRTQKFLFVLSKYSNQKHDPLGELTTAFNIAKKEKLKNFIVPLKVDALELSQTDFRLQNIQSISFTSWPTGLRQLLKILERDNVNKNVSFTPNAVSQWWQNYKSVDSVISDATELLFSNWYPIVSYPQCLHLHHILNMPKNGDLVPFAIPFKQYLLSFVEKEELHRCISNLKIGETEEININEIMNGTTKFIESSKQGKYLITQLFNQLLLQSLRNKGMLSYTLANGKNCFYFHQGLLPEGKIIYTCNKELSPLIKLWGDTLGEKWHWAMRGWFRSTPIWHYNIQPHILVSGSNGEVRPAPKRVYYRWNNSTWRDRLKAAITHLAGENETVVIQASNKQAIHVDKTPVLYVSPITFIEPKAKSSTGNEEE